MNWKCSPVVPGTNTAAHGCIVILLEPAHSMHSNESVEILSLSQLSGIQEEGIQMEKNL